MVIFGPFVILQRGGWVTSAVCSSPVLLTGHKEPVPRPQKSAICDVYGHTIAISSVEVRPDALNYTIGFATPHRLHKL